MLSGCQETRFQNFKLSDQPKTHLPACQRSTFFIHHWSNGFTNGFQHWSKQNPGCRRMRLISSLLFIICHCGRFISIQHPVLQLKQPIYQISHHWSSPVWFQQGGGEVFINSCSWEICQSVKSQVTSLESRISQGRTQFSMRRNISLFCKDLSLQFCGQGEEEEEQSNLSHLQTPFSSSQFVEEKKRSNQSFLICKPIFPQSCWRGDQDLEERKHDLFFYLFVRKTRRVQINLPQASLLTKFNIQDIIAEIPIQSVED